MQNSFIVSKSLSIPLWCDCDPPTAQTQLAQRFTFNPTVVRLRPFNDLPEALVIKAFNPTVVRLRPEKPVAVVTPLKTFNPTVVRLRPPVGG